MERYVPKYKETINDMNKEWSNLLTAFKTKDTRTEYLGTFEQALALNLPFSLWENGRYIRVTSQWPLPESGYVSVQKFRGYMMLYYFIMRDGGLLDRESDRRYSDGNEAFERGA